MSCGASLWDEPLRAVAQSVHGCHHCPSGLLRHIPSFPEQERGALWGLAGGLWEGHALGRAPRLCGPCLDPHAVIPTDKS